MVFLFGASSLASILLIPLAAVLLGLTAVLVGMALGYAIALLIATSAFVARHKTILGGVAVLGAMGGYLTFSLPQFGGMGQEALAVLPVGWFIDIAIIGSPIHGSMSRAAVAVAGSLLLVVGGIPLVEWEAVRLWFTDPVRGEEEQVESESVLPERDEERTALAEAISPLGIPRGITQPTRRVAQWSLLRTRRDPRRLNFLLLPIAMVGSALVSTGMQAESPWALFAPAAAVLLPWMAGATFAMNPFGDEGAVLPVTLIAISGRSYVRGLILPGLLLGLPLVVLLTGGAAVLGPFGLTIAAGLVGVSLLSTAVAVTTAPAVGMWFPRFSAISIGQSREVIPPRLFTTALHFFGVTIPGALLAVLLLDPQLARQLVALVTGFLPAALLGLLASGNGGVLTAAASWFQGVGTAVQSIGVESFQFGAGGILVVGAIGVSILAYRLSIRRFDRYSPPT
jgi:hypothetical protein